MSQAICNRCKNYCVLDIEKVEDAIEVAGNKCSEGIEFAEEEVNNTKAIFTSLVRIKGADVRVVSVKSNKPIEKSMFIKCSIALSRIYVGAPIDIGDVVCKNILNTGVDIVCTKNVSKMNV